MGTQITGWIAAAAESDIALGASKNFTAIQAATFVAFFDVNEVNAALTAAGALVSGQELWCVLQASGEFRMAVPLVYRLARIN